MTDDSEAIGSVKRAEETNRRHTISCGRLSSLSALMVYLVVWSLLPQACAQRKVMTLTCREVRNGAIGAPWIFRIYPSSNDAEMIVHVPKDSIEHGVPTGNRRGSMHVTERGYEIVIPADGGGRGDDAWIRMQFSLDLDRFTGNGTVEIGEQRYGETLRIPVQCGEGVQKPLF